MKRAVPYAVLWVAFLVSGCDSEKQMSRIAAGAKPGLQEFWMERFKGLEIYQIESAKWNFYEDGARGGMNLWLSVDGGSAIKQFEDTEYVRGAPDWELNLVEVDLKDSILEAGFRASIPSGYDERRGGWITNLYFTSHDGSDENTIEVLQRDGDRLLIRLTGEIVDVNYYDDSKPRSKLLVETWFHKDPKGKRSMQ
jgi:hypothetical protein